jgi:hypothetical protein
MGPGSNVGPVAQSCDQLSSSAATTRSDGIAELDQTCTTNADCTVVDASLSCTACTYDIAVSINASADLQTLLSNIEAGACQSFSDMDCVLLQPPCTSAPNPRGVCQFAPAVPGGDTAASGVCTLVVGEDACRAESTDALQLVFSALDEAAQGCESVADCEEIPEPHVSCTQDDGACGAKAAIATIHKQAFEERLTEIEGSCTEFNQSNCTLDDNCPPTTPALELACVEGVCTETSPGAAD